MSASRVRQKTRAVLIGGASGLLYGTIVFVTTRLAGGAPAVAWSAFAVQFAASASKSAMSYLLVAKLQSRARTMLGKLVASYACLPATLAYYGALHVVFRTPNVASKLATVGLVMAVYYALLFAVHVRDLRLSPTSTSA